MPRSASLPLIDVLPTLDANVDAVVTRTRAAHPYWPCAAGCDHCCRSLPHLPIVRPSEWARMAAAIEALDPHVRADAVARTQSAPEQGPLTCPLLDLESGRCRIYDARPIACRTYGYYADREAAQCCEKVLEAVTEHDDEARVIWGNGEAIERALDAEGAGRSLRELLRGVGGRRGGGLQRRRWIL